MTLKDLLNKLKKEEHPSQFDYIYDKDRYAYVMVNKEGKYFVNDVDETPYWTEDIKSATILVTDSNTHESIIKALYSELKNTFERYPEMFVPDEYIHFFIKNGKFNTLKFFKYIMTPRIKFQNPKGFFIKKVRYWDYFAKKLLGGNMFPCFYYSEMAPYLAYNFKEDFNEYDIELADRFKELLKEQIGDFIICNVGDTTTIGYPSIIGKQLSDEFDKGEICEYIATPILKETIDVNENRLYESLKYSLLNGRLDN